MAYLACRSDPALYKGLNRRVLHLARSVRAVLSDRVMSQRDLCCSFSDFTLMSTLLNGSSLPICDACRWPDGHEHFLEIGPHPHLPLILSAYNLMVHPTSLSEMPVTIYQSTLRNTPLDSSAATTSHLASCLLQSSDTAVYRSDKQLWSLLMEYGSVLHMGVLQFKILTVKEKKKSLNKTNGH